MVIHPECLEPSTSPLPALLSHLIFQLEVISDFGILHEDHATIQPNVEMTALTWNRLLSVDPSTMQLLQEIS